MAGARCVARLFLVTRYRSFSVQYFYGHVYHILDIVHPTKGTDPEPRYVGGRVAQLSRSGGMALILLKSGGREAAVVLHPGFHHPKLLLQLRIIPALRGQVRRSPQASPHIVAPLGRREASPCGHRCQNAPCTHPIPEGRHVPSFAKPHMCHCTPQVTPVMRGLTGHTPQERDHLCATLPICS